MTKTSSPFDEICTISNEALRALCVEHNWFTAGTNKQYAKLSSLNSSGSSIQTLADFICSHSVDISLDDIVSVLFLENSAPATSPLETPAPAKATKPAKSAETPAVVNPSPAKAKSGKVETSLAPATKAKAIKQLEGITADIRKQTGNIASAYMCIGFNLWKVKNDKLYLAVDVDGKPLNNVYDYCEIAFGFKRTSAKNFITVCEKFSTKDAKGQPTANIDPAFALFGYSQLTEMVSLPVENLPLVDPAMTVKDIRNLKSGQTSDQSDGDGNDEPTEKTRRVAFSGEVNEKTYDTILDRLDKLIGFRIQIIVEK